VKSRHMICLKMPLFLQCSSSVLSDEVEYEVLNYFFYPFIICNLYKYIQQFNVRVG
jgi:hypothetical protein